MPLDTKRAIDLAESDILELISNGTEEGREIDYKELLKIGSDGERKEFLADISSFANASGGHLIFGVAETDGRPTAIKPLTITNWDAERLRIESLVRDGISPRLAMEPTAVAVPSGHVIVLRIPRSWSGPHMVRFQHSGRFYSRNSGGKYQLDVGEIRTAFTSGAQVADAIRTFRQTRLSAIVSGEAPVRLLEGPKIILHCCPYTSTALGASVDIRKAQQQPALVRPMFDFGHSPGYNLDGVMAYSPERAMSGFGQSYFQLFRDGKVECVDSQLLRPKEGRGRVMPSIAVPGICIASLSRIFKLFRVLDVEPPAAVMLTFLGVESYTMALDPMLGYGSSEIDRDALIIAAEIADSYEPATAATIMRPIFDTLWNATGLSHCSAYDAAGEPCKELRNYIQRMG
jgi:hypothetical protein